MIYIYAQREGCNDRLMGTLDQLQKFGTNQAVAFVNLLDQYGYWPEGYEAVVFSPDEGEDNQGIVYHFTDTLEMLGTFDTRSSFLVGKMPEVFYNPGSEPSYGPASNAQEWWG